MAYTAWSVVFGEQPTAAKWNQLGANDAGFKDGTNIDASAIVTAKIADANITYAKLLSTIFSGQIQSYTNTGSGGGTCYYINLGGLKIAFGTTGLFNTVAGANYFASMPVGFFTAVRGGTIFNPQSSAVISQVGSNLSTTSIQQYIQTISSNVSISFIVIGT